MSKDEYLITDTPLKALTVFAMPMILGSFFQLVEALGFHYTRSCCITAGLYKQLCIAHGNK